MTTSRLGPVVVLDTNIVSYEFTGHAIAVQYDRHLRGTHSAISFVTLAEMYKGAYLAGWSAVQIDSLQRHLDRYMFISYDRSIARAWARIKADDPNDQIPCEDSWIAASALSFGCPVVTHDPNDFRGIHGLNVITELT